MNSMVFVICCILLDNVASDSWNFAGNNIALGKNTTQTPGTFKKYTSDLAVDGNTNHNMGAGSCSHTSGKKNTEATWTVDLNGTYTLKGIRIFNRDSHQNRHKNFRIIGLPSSTTLHDDRIDRPQLYNNSLIDVAIDSVKRFSSILLVAPSRSWGSSFLQLCEVQIYSESHDCLLPASSGSLMITMRNGTGYLNSIKQLVSTGTVLDFSCDGNYTLIGSKSTMCLANRSFNATVPTCVEIQCSMPTNFSNGNYTQITFSNYSVIIYWECAPGYKSEQNRTMQCLASGNWSEDQPICERITCLFPNGFVNGTLKLENNTYFTFGTLGSGTAVYVLCAKGFDANVPRIECTEDGQWDNLPQCRPVQCSRPVMLTGGHYTYMLNGDFMDSNQDFYEYGTVATAVCNETLFRLSMDNAALRTCGHDGNWTGHDGLCDALCKAPSLLNGDFQDQTGTEFYEAGQSLKPICVDGFEFDTKVQITIQCQPNHTWSPPVPKCIALKCSLGDLQPDHHFYDLEENANGTIKFNETLLTDCKAGYEHYSGHKERKCIANQTLSGTELQCTATKCSLGDLRPDHHFYDLKENVSGTIKFNDTLIADCKTGYEHSSGEKERICLANQTLSDTELQCSALKCSLGDLQPDRYFYNLKQYETGSINFNDTFLADCKAGYEHSSGYKERRCLANQTLSGTELQCTAVISADAAQYTNMPAAVVGGVSSAVLVLAAGATVMCLVIRRRRTKAKSPDTTSKAESLTVQAFSNDVYKETTIYENNADIKDDNQESYYNITDIHKIPDNAIMLEILSDLVLTPDLDTGRFKKEFDAFPEGMTKQYINASKNMHRNRYRGLYAYDDTRVVLDIWDTEKDSDYINACYIRGFNEPNAYIASQGPVEDILNDFWRMVWQNNCGKIVMLTNLMEHGKMKCKQYWPPNGTKTYGSVDVTLKNTETFANFVIRTLVVSKGQEQRNVIQFHFTAWPDKDVPYFCSAFVHFRSKVKAAETSCDGPLVVHCSAGIGRTGTFIAVDYLVDEAEKHGYVHVSSCVESLRNQRVNMVQTKKQYVFVHLALVEILTMKTSVVSTAIFEETYQELLSVDKGKRRIDLEFEVLWGIMPVDDDNQSNDAKDFGTKSQNRYSNILPFKAFMPSLSQPGPGYMFGEFINAAFLPMYKEDNALIITQSPLETTIEDFWNMVLHQGVHIIVMVNHVTELKETERYWPDLDKRKMYKENFHIDNKNVDKKGGHTIVTLTITTEKEVRDMKLIQFEKWGKSQSVPDAAAQILSALELMEECQRQSGNHPVIVHCMDGVEKSGLFCVMAAVLDRLKVEQEVAISQVIQEMRNRRQNVIPNVTQFQFCHEVVLAFLKQYDTYSNFEFQL